MLLGAAHAGREVLQAIHVQPATPIAGWQNPLSLSQTFHPVDHFGLERPAVILLRRLASALTRCWQEIGWRVRYGDG